MSRIIVRSETFQTTLVLVRLKTPVSENKLIPDHQFGFKNNHSTIEQVYNVYNVISNSIEEKKYCSAAFIDIQQAFDKVWHRGLLYEIKTNLSRYFLLFKSNLYNRRFYVRYGHDIAECHPIKSGVPQGSVLGPVLYTISAKIKGSPVFSIKNVSILNGHNFGPKVVQKFKKARFEVRSVDFVNL